MKMNRIAIAAIAVVAMVGCEKEGSVDFASDTAATFASSQIITRTIDSDWESGDQVGIHMYKSGETSMGNYQLAKENVLHKSDDSGNFSTDTPIYYPQSDVVDFHAYYPYKSTAGATYSIDITEQNLNDGGFDQGAVDFMTASLTGKQKSSKALTFDFTHRLSFVTFVITPKSSITSLAGLKVSIAGVNTEAVLSTVDGSLISSSTIGSVKFQTAETTGDQTTDVKKVTATAILLPGVLNYEDDTDSDDITDVVITFELSATDSFTARFPVVPTLTPEKKHTYNISVGYGTATFGTATITGWVPTDDPDTGQYSADEQ